MQVNRRLYRCTHDRRIAGVASGIAEYFDVDPTIVRILWVLSIFFGGLGLLLYIAMAIIVPLEPEGGIAPHGATGAGGTADVTGETPTSSPTDWNAVPSNHRHPRRGGGTGTVFLGMILVLFGALALVDTFLPAWADGGRFLWPAFILGIGALLVASAVRRQPTDS
jgi:phage shock protein PspC (stress-responsive transcriptional regulator)